MAIIHLKLLLFILAETTLGCLCCLGHKCNKSELLRPAVDFTLLQRGDVKRAGQLADGRRPVALIRLTSKGDNSQLITGPPIPSFKEIGRRQFAMPAQNLQHLGEFVILNKLN
jgi:hypothetical protein